MKLSCQSCQAKYTIADEKVLGKIVKIRCKKCSATIVISGPVPVQPREDATDVVSNVFDYTAGSTETWTVNVDDGDQRTLSTSGVVREYRFGVVNDDTYCWKDGMADWLPLREIEQIYRLVAEGPRPTLRPDNDSTSAYQPPSGGHAASATSGTRVHEEASAIDVMGRRKRVDPRTRWPIDFGGHGAGIREEMRRIISRCIDPRPGLGFGSFEELERALERIGKT